MNTVKPWQDGKIMKTFVNNFWRFGGTLLQRRSFNVEGKEVERGRGWKCGRSVYWIMICHPEFLKALPLHRIANSNIFHLNWPATTGKVNNRGIRKLEWGGSRSIRNCTSQPIPPRLLEEHANYNNKNKNTNLHLRAKLYIRILTLPRTFHSDIE